MIDTEGEFIPPPEAPVFEPTWEEFQEPLVYINKIRPIAQKTGICKVRPPPDWQPPFAVNVDTFRFTPRVQRLNELEAKTRIKLNFLDRLAKFWELQGTPLRIPLVERKYLDLYSLHKVVQEEGTYDIICRERKWSKVASRLGYPGGKNVGSSLRQHYEKLIHPYDVFLTGQPLAEDKKKKESPIKKESPMKKEIPIKTEPGSDPVKAETSDVRPGDDGTNPAENGSIKTEGSEMSTRRSKRINKECIDLNPELRKLQFYGPGPKMAIPEEELDEEEVEEVIEIEETNKATTAASKKGRMKTRDKKNISYVDQYMCHVCCKGDNEESMLLCDGCDDAYHTFCLIPPLNDIPGGDWRCPRCVAKECNKPKAAYGFEQAKREYSLHTYGEMADQFKLDYFNMPVHLVPCSTVEREFWRLVNCIEEDVVVEYGADIHAMEFGSGFPTKADDDIRPEDEEYIHSGWNLNNMQGLDQSILKYISGDISGMKVPWCYVGMCFSSFAWHTEDHWSYSINYMHWGEPKTWYGVPGAKAELLEECMKKNAPELFEQSPDLLHQLTTIMNPNTLMAYGVPIVRTNQCAGEFVITFPRAYHAGFNQGYNFAEAVNFCPADWIPMGRSCVNHYRKLKRQCVFSHEELICKMATYPDRIDLNLAAALHQDMLILVEEEKELRKKLLDMGITEAEREAFELLPDDERQCAVCKTTCFLSAVTCPCTPDKLVCIYHVSSLCACDASKLCLRYRYTLDELPAMLHRLKVRAESFDSWAFKVKMVLEAEQADKVDLPELRELLVEAREKKFPDSPLLTALSEAVNEAEKCSSVASQLLSHKVRTRNRQSGDSKYVAKLSLEELQCFSEQIQALACRINESKQIQELVDQVEKFQAEAQAALDEVTPNSARLQELMDTAITLDVDLQEIPRLKQLLQQAYWLDEVNQTLSDSNDVTLDAMRKLLETGVTLAPHHACERAMAELQELLTVSERWEEKARLCLHAKPYQGLPALETILSETYNIPTMLPNISALTEAVRKAKEWIARVNAIQTGEHYPYLESLEALAAKGRPLPVALDHLPQLESQVSLAKSWRERTARTFLKKNSTYSLVEVLSPRTNIGQQLAGKFRRKKPIRDGSGDRESKGDQHVIGDIKTEDNRDPATIVAAFKVAEGQEVVSMQELRKKNVTHYQQEALGGKYCLCRRVPAGLMLQCELCKDWFHSACVPLPKSANLKAKTSPSALMQAAKDFKFLCPLCLRSRRPRLETILSLLVSLQKLPVRLPEGEALQCLTERAMAWQDKARQALATDELSSALAKLSVLSQKMVEQAAREKTEKIISAELMKAASNPDLQPPASTGDHQPPAPTGPVDAPMPPAEGEDVSHPQSLYGYRPISANGTGAGSTDSANTGPIGTSSTPTDSAPGFGATDAAVTTGMGLTDPSSKSAETALVPGDPESNQMESGEDIVVDENKPEIPENPPSPTTSDDSPSDPETLGISQGLTQGLGPEQGQDMTSEHAYSSVFKSVTAGPVLPKKQQRKTTLVPRQLTDVSVLKLSSPAQRQLEVLMMEGDLLEVSLDETQHIWRILQSCSPGASSRVLHIQGSEAEALKLKAEKKKKRKKELGDPMNPGTEEFKPKKIKKKKIILPDGTEKYVREGGDKKPRDPEKKRKRMQKKKEAMIVDDEDDNCAAIKCLKPTGDEVNWVQCDGCELWFHLLCVGLGEDEVSENVDYICYECRKKKAGVDSSFSMITARFPDSGMKTQTTSAAPAGSRPGLPSVTDDPPRVQPSSINQSSFPPVSGGQDPAALPQPAVKQAESQNDVEMTTGVSTTTQHSPPQGGSTDDGVVEIEDSDDEQSSEAGTVLRSEVMVEEIMDTGAPSDDIITSVTKQPIWGQPITTDLGTTAIDKISSPDPKMVGSSLPVSSEDLVLNQADPIIPTPCAAPNIPTTVVELEPEIGNSADHTDNL